MATTMCIFEMRTVLRHSTRSTGWWRSDPKKEVQLKAGEVFKNIGTYKGHDLSLYEISNYGTVRNAETGQILKPYVSHDYHHIGLVSKQTGKQRKIPVHDLVATCFI